MKPVCILQPFQQNIISLHSSLTLGVCAIRVQGTGASRWVEQIHSRLAVMVITVGYGANRFQWIFQNFCLDAARKWRMCWERKMFYPAVPLAQTGRCALPTLVSNTTRLAHHGVPRACPFIMFNYIYLMLHLHLVSSFGCSIFKAF